MFPWPEETNSSCNERDLLIMTLYISLHYSCSVIYFNQQILSGAAAGAETVELRGRKIADRDEDNRQLESQGTNGVIIN